MENINITEIIGAVVAVLTAIISAFVIPYIKSKTTVEQYNLIKAFVKTGVYFAESYFNSEYGQGEEKREYVIGYVKEKCEALGISFDLIDVTQMIEEAWINLTGGVSDESQLKDEVIDEK